MVNSPKKVVTVNGHQQKTKQVSHRSRPTHWGVQWPSPNKKAAYCAGIEWLWKMIRSLWFLYILCIYDVYTYLYTHIYMYIYIYMYTCIYIYTVYMYSMWSICMSISCYIRRWQKKKKKQLGPGCEMGFLVRFHMSLSSWGSQAFTKMMNRSWMVTRWGPQSIDKLVHITPISLWFMVRK